MISDLYQSPLRYGVTYDEASADGVTPRPHWAHMMDSLRDIGPEELEHRCIRAERRIRENGITYNIYGDPLGANRPWQIDLVPLLISAEEWRTIEAGVTQRARLLGLLLQDLYGPQTLLTDGKFPASLVYANPEFLRPMVGVDVPAHSHLHMLAVDLARSLDGQWWVLADRTQAPSGSGYALENRTIVSDLLPELFRTSNVQRLASFSAPSATPSPVSPAAATHALFCSLPGRITRPTSNTPILRNISASPSSKVRTSPSASVASISRPSAA